MYWRTSSTRWKWRRASWNIGSVRFARQPRRVVSVLGGQQLFGIRTKERNRAKTRTPPTGPDTYNRPNIKSGTPQINHNYLDTNKKTPQEKKLLRRLGRSFVRELLAVGAPDDRVLDFDVSVGVVYVDLIFDRGGTVGVSFALLEESKRLPEHR